MASSHNIGEALSRVQKIISSRDDIHVIHSSEISRSDRELLLKEGWLQELIRAWYLLVRPDSKPGSSSTWYTTFWGFLHVYLSHFYGKDYCLSPEQSLDLHLGMTVVPRQVIVMAPKGRGTPIKLPFDTSLLIYASGDQLPPEREVIQKLQVMSLPYALCKASPAFFQRQPREAEIALQSISNSDDLIRTLVSNNFTRAAGRLIGTYRFLGNKKMVDELLKGLAIVHLRVQESNPFLHETPILKGISTQSPYAARITAMWQEYRTDVIQLFPKSPGIPSDIKTYLKQLDEQYTQDAYHSLSIEGYQVNVELIDKVKNAKWNPDKNLEDQKQRNALAARGYYEAFLSVKSSLETILKENVSPGKTVETDLSDWYRKLFNPCAAAGFMDQSDLFGYRRHQVYIQNSRHTPLPAHALLDAMDAFFHCLQNEEHAGVRAVLGHFIFVFIHPYMDGNGRIGRFIMNIMLGSGGYPWLIIHSENRNQYMDALEKASCENDITALVNFLKSQTKK